MPKKAKAEVQVLSETEQERLKEYVERHETLSTLGIAVCLYTGIRIGELCAMQWKDIDLEKRTLTVRKTIQRIQTPDNVTLAEKLSICDELEKNLGVSCGMFHVDPSMPEEGIGRNALVKKGDVTLDCEVDIMDVIATNKYLLGAKKLCNTAEKNADVSGDGTPDESDSLAILKEVVGLTADVAEP